jgi:hypothetical protein
MIAVETKETLHIYYEREKPKKPFLFPPLFFALLCLFGIVAITIYSWQHPTYEHETLTVPAHFFTRTYSAAAQIVPTGVKTSPATAAHGNLTLTNGSVVSQELPQGLIFSSSSGIEVVTLSSVFVPAGSASGYGVATVPAQAVVSGVQGNIPAFSINVVYGTSLYIRNLQPFTGGQNTRTVIFITSQDRQTALDSARALLTTQQAKLSAVLAYPCKESSQEKNSRLRLSWYCQYVSYRIPAYMNVTRVRLSGSNLLIDVVFVARPRRTRV